MRAKMSLVKPKMRGLLTSQIQKNIIIGAIISLTLAGGYKFGVLDARKAKYAEFYKTYDAQADFERMKDLGLFQSCKTK